jgi:hypothetical protein
MSKNLPGSRSLRTFAWMTGGIVGVSRVAEREVRAPQALDRHCGLCRHQNSLSLLLDNGTFAGLFLVRHHGITRWSSSQVWSRWKAWLFFPRPATDMVIMRIDQGS